MKYCENKKCIVCDNKKSKTIFTENGIDVLRCQNCGHVFSDYNQDQDYDGYFGYDERSGDDEYFWWDQAHGKMYDDFCDRFISGKSGRLLDVGCGLGYFVKKISEFEDWEAIGCEISKIAADFAREKLHLKNIYCGKLEEAEFGEAYFDIISMWDVIEHLPNPGTMLALINRMLKPDGFLFIHTPNIKIQLPKAKIKKMIFGAKKNIHYLEARDHINIYSEQAIKKVLQKKGFKKIDFIHLHPIQGVSGSKNKLKIFIKNTWHNLSIFLFKFSNKKINLNNLFVIARKD